MHPALQNYDILLNVFGFFVCTRDEDRRQRNRLRRGTLLDLASTCQAFSDPALDVLWKSIDSLLPLFALARGLVSDEESSVQGERIQPEEWKTVSRHAKRVRSLATDGTSRYETAYRQIAELKNHGDPFLPGLQHLSITIDTQTTLEGLTLAATPTIRSLSIRNAKGYDVENSWSSQLIDQFMAAVVDAQPRRLHSLELDIGLSQWWAYGLLSKLNLRHLTITTPIDADFFATTILNMHHLTTLSIVIEDGTNPKELFPASSMPNTPFKDLKSLEVYAEPICLLSIVRKFDAPGLRELNLGSSEDSGSSWWEDCYNVTTRRWRKQVRLSGFSGDRL